MRNLIVSLIFLGIAGFAVKYIIDDYEYNNGRIQEKTYLYPDTIVIENKEGAKIEITLLARNSTHLEFKQQNGRKSIYPIRSLSQKSQTEVMKYPDTGIQDASAYLSGGGIEMNDVYIIQMEGEIRKIREEIQRLNVKAKSTTSQTELRTLERKIETLNEDIADLENKIASRR